MRKRWDRLNEVTAKPFIPWVGGKEKLQGIIRPLFPKDIDRYVEHFGGSGAILLGLPKSTVRTDIYNDYYSDLTNLFVCVRDKPLALLKELEFLPLHSEEEYGLLKSLLDHEMPVFDFTEEELAVAENNFTLEEYEELCRLLTGKSELWDVQRATAFYKVIRYSFSGTLNSFGIKKNSIKGFLRLIELASERLDGVVITNRDCCDSIAVNNKLNTLHYCDPPYYKAEDKYKMLFSEGDHIRLHDALKKCVGYVVVSYNFCPFICELYEDFFIMRFDRQNPLAKKKGSVYEEVVITNYDPIPVIESNTSQMSMFMRQDASQEKGELVLIHTPTNMKKENTYETDNS